MGSTPSMEMFRHAKHDKAQLPKISRVAGEAWPDPRPEPPDEHHLSRRGRGVGVVITRQAYLIGLSPVRLPCSPSVLLPAQVMPSTIRPLVYLHHILPRFIHLTPPHHRGARGAYHCYHPGPPRSFPQRTRGRRDARPCTNLPCRPSQPVTISTFQVSRRRYMHSYLGTLENGP